MRAVANALSVCLCMLSFLCLLSKDKPAGDTFALMAIAFAVMGSA